MIKYINLNKREQIILILTILIVMVTLGYILLVEPAVNKISQVNKEIAGLELKLKKARTVIARKDKIEEEYKEFAQFISSKTGAGEDLDKFLSDVEKIASTADYKVNQVRPLPSRKTDFYQVSQMEVDGLSGMTELAKFIYNLQTSNELYRVSSIRIRPESRKSSRLKSTLLITTLSLP